MLVNNQCEPCPAGSFSFRYDPKASCAPCPDNTDGCAGGVIHAAKGYWRASPTATKLLKCPLEKGCVGGSESGSSASSGAVTGVSAVVGAAAVGSVSARRLAVDSFSGPGCAVGYLGPLCAVCAQGYYLDKLVKECVSCEGSGGGSQLAILILVPLAMLIIGAIASIFRMRQALSTYPPSELHSHRSQSNLAAGGSETGAGSGEEEGESKHPWSLWSATIQLDKIGPKVRNSG